METPSRETEPYRVVPECVESPCVDEVDAEFDALRECTKPVPPDGHFLHLPPSVLKRFGLTNPVGLEGLQRIAAATRTPRRMRAQYIPAREQRVIGAMEKALREIPDTVEYSVVSTPHDSSASVQVPSCADEMEAVGEAVVPLPDCKASVQALLGQVHHTVRSNTTPLRFPDLSTPAAKERFKSVLLDAYQRMPRETEQLSVEEISELLRPVIAQIDLLVRAGNQVGRSTRTLRALIEDSWEQQPTVLDWMSYWVNPLCGCKIHAKLDRTTPPPHAPQCGV